MATLKYKGYLANVDYSVDDKVFYGKLWGINDLVDFMADKASDIEEEFHKAVDDYIAFCEEVGKNPEKCFNGTFNVRFSPELHKEVAFMASQQGITLNQFMINAAKNALLAQ